MRALLHHPASGIFQILLLAGRLLVCSHVQHTMRQLYILRRNLLQCVILTIMYSTTTYLHFMLDCRYFTGNGIILNLSILH